MRLKEESHSNIYIAELEFLDGEIVKNIEDITSLRFASGKRLRLYNLPLIIEDLSKSLHRDFGKEEVLLISKDKKEIIDVIYSISHIFNFISIIGVEDDEGEDIYNTVFEDTGLSIFQPKNVDNILKDYGVIVNLDDKAIFDERNISKKTLVFDFSILRPFRSFARNMLIYDIKVDVQGLDTRNGFKMDRQISSRVYESLFGEKMVKYCQIVTGDKSYGIGKYVEHSIRIKGNL